MARRIALVLEYEGTAYSGFQLQRNAPSIQGEVEQAIERMTGDRARLAGAGRTDAGVHAIGQVAAFDTESTIEVGRFETGLNHFLPDDIVVVRVWEAEKGFDPRLRSCTSGPGASLTLRRSETWGRSKGV